jgi:DNA polymerase-3 subunit alpha
MVKAGSFDGFGRGRASMAAALPAAIQLGEQRTRASAAGQDDLFGGLAAEAAHDSAPPAVVFPTLPEWSEAERLAGERETLGLFLSGHPITEYEQELRQVAPARIVDLGGPRPTGEPRYGGGRNVTVAGLVLEIRKRGSRTTLVLDDRSARIEASLFDDVWQQHRAVIARDAILVVEGQLRYDEFIDDWRINAKKLTPVHELREREARRLKIRLPAGGGDARLIARLEEILRAGRGGRCTVELHYIGAEARGTLALGEDWSVRPTRQLVDELARLVGRDGLRFAYGPRTD